MRLHQRLHLAVSAIALAAAISGGAAAQPAAPSTGQPQTLQEVVVTGSRIARRDYVAQSPIVTQSVQTLQSAGQPTIEASLLQLPQFQPSQGGYTNNSAGGLGVGQSTVSLRNLGANRTLVLLDGRRAQPGNAQNTIDLNTIPTIALSGVEVITGGASATYGSDAIAGVVNFKLRKRFTGLELDAQYGASEHGDAQAKQFQVLAGQTYAGGAGSFFVAGEYSDRGAVGYADRSWSKPTQNGAVLLTNGYYAPSGPNLPSQAAVNAVFSKYGVTATLPRTTNFGVNADGSLFQSGGTGINYKPSGDTCVLNNVYGSFSYDGLCTNQLQSPLRRYAALGRTDYQLTSDTTLFVQGQFAHTYATGQGSPPTIAAVGATGLVVPVTNPLIPADLQALLASRTSPTATFTYVDRFSVPRRYSTLADTYQVVAGAQGKISGIGWNWEAYASHGATAEQDRTLNGVSISTVNSLLNAPDGGKSVCSGGLNLFGPSLLSASCISYITRNTLSVTNITQDVLAANMSGALFKLPAGDVKASVDVDYRQNTFHTKADPVLAAGDISGVNAVQPLTGKTSASEAGVELLIPVLADLPLIRSLNISPAYRYTQNHPSGGVSTYRVNADWRLLDSLLVRGGYQNAIRAANIGELYQPATAIVAGVGSPPGAGDPCDVRSNFRLGPNAAQVAALCVAQGVPAAIISAYNQPNVGVPGTSSGNPNLRPEQAITYTIGAVFQPKFLGDAFSRMSLSVDYYNMDITGVIGTLSPSTALNKCFNGDGSNPTYAITSPFCSAVVRSNQTGQIINAVQTLQNLGAYRLNGVDTTLDWRIGAADVGLPSKFGSVLLSSTISYLGYFGVQPTSTSAFQNYAGTMGSNNAAGANAAYPTWKWLDSITYEVGDYSLAFRWEHVSASKDPSTVTNPASTTPGAKTYDVFGLTGRAKLFSRYELRAGINNLFDRNPPTEGGLRGFTNNGAYDVIGRTYFVGLKAAF